MESKTINLWDKMVENASEGLKEYFIEEEKFLKENICRQDFVLDLGCGAGRTIKIISPICKEVMGIDNDKEAVINGNKNLAYLRNAKIILSDAKKIPFRNESFDKVFIGLTFVNFGETKFKILEEIKRILKIDGDFIFSVYNENSLSERLRLYNKYEKRKIIIDNSGNVRFGDGAVSEKFSKEGIIRILEGAGFKVRRIIKGKIFYLIEAYKLPAKNKMYYN